MPRRTGILSGLAALAIALALWMPCLHLFFQRPAAEFCRAQGLSATARELAARHLRLWTEPARREAELRRMRASNAEWDFMGRSFLVWSLANMSQRDAEHRRTYLETSDRIIDETLRLEKEHGIYYFLMPYAKARPYKVEPAQSLFLDGEMALMLACRCFVEDKADYRSLLTERVHRIAAGMKRNPWGVLESYPDECWMFDHAVALAALRLADRLDGSDHSSLWRDWLAMAKQKLVHRESGLLVSSFTTDAKPLDGPEGSTIWMVAHCLQVLDEDFARDQFARARRELGRTTLGFSYAREWPATWKGPADIDSGPIIPVFQISAGSSGLAFIGAAAFGDDAFLSSLAATLEFAAFPSRHEGTLRYCASNQVGDAAMLYAATLGPIWQTLRAEATP
jgi:hypothetical protein